jgi:hypothetical protein
VDEAYCKSIFQGPQRRAAGGLGLLPIVIFYFGLALRLVFFSFKACQKFQISKAKEEYQGRNWCRA